MKYPVLITKHIVSEQYELTVPDLPGCQEKSGSIDEGMNKLTAAIAAHLRILAEYGESIPRAKTLDFHISECKELSPIWAIIDIDITPYLGKSHKINVTLPELLIKQIDDRVSKSPAYKTRSGFIAMACMQELEK